ncbi:tyrosine-type recombinase/integrase [Alkaliphilus crotonatoxidans]
MFLTIFKNIRSQRKEVKTIIGTTKNKRKEKFLFQKKLVPKLKEYKKLKATQELKADHGVYEDQGFFFSNQFGGPVDSRNLRRSFARILKAAGISYKKFHTSRHTFATKLFEKDVPLSSVQELLGHSSSKTTEIYTHVSKEKKVEAVNKINDLFI